MSPITSFSLPTEHIWEETPRGGLRSNGIAVLSQNAWTTGKP